MLLRDFRLISGLIAPTFLLAAVYIIAGHNRWGCDQATGIVLQQAVAEEVSADL